MVEAYTCKCQHLFCSSHLHNHICVFDHKKNQKLKIKKELPLIKKDKIKNRI